MAKMDIEVVVGCYEELLLGFRIVQVGEVCIFGVLFEIFKLTYAFFQSFLENDHLNFRKCRDINSTNVCLWKI